MYDIGKRVRMTKGYRGMEGVILEKADSQLEFYVVKLENEIHIVVGPSAFVIQEQMEV